MYADLIKAIFGNKVAKSNAERQRAYRERHLNSLEAGGERLNAIINLSAKRSLEQLATCYGVTQREALEQAIEEAQNRLLSKLSSDEQAAYYKGQLNIIDRDVAQ